MNELTEQDKAQNDQALSGQVEPLVMRLQEIRCRLAKTTKPGPWTAEKGGTPYLFNYLGEPGKSHFTPAEDDCILDANKEEVIGCSEWMRVEWDDLEFMAHSKSDIEFLLFELERFITA